MKSVILVLAVLAILVVVQTPATASDFSVWLRGGRGVARENHARHHDDLDHRAFHRELDHAAAHRYPMTYRQHDRLHDHLDHEAYHDYLEHCAAHRSRAYSPYSRYRYGHGYHGIPQYNRRGWSIHFGF